MQTCPNNACGKTFARPLTLSNVQHTSKEPYNACPYCLTEIIALETKDENLPEETAPELDVEEICEQNHEELPDCKKYFGYLNEKQPNQPIPEECMLCSRIINCMGNKA